MYVKRYELWRIENCIPLGVKATRRLVCVFEARSTDERDEMVRLLGAGTCDLFDTIEVRS